MMRAAATRLAVVGIALALAACSDDPAPPTDGPAIDVPVVDPVYDDQGREIDPATGLIRAEGWVHVATNCVACHSAKQFLRQRGTRQTWQHVIDWMQATQGLWEFPEGVEERIVDYLATNYGPSGEWRRAPIPATLMPPNPYASEIREQVDALRERGALPTGPDSGR